MESSSPLSSAKTSGLNQDTPRLNFPAVKRQRMSNGTHESVDSHTHNASDLHFKPGAIKRIRMIDFMTYQDCEYHLWPALNMIIGANGTGKSSVIAAICLGLGFDAKIMGRAEAYEMVRHGCEAATVEIEIKAHSDHQEDPIIQRHWTRGDGEQSKSKTDWHISGKKVTHKAVMELVRSYRVQIDNLCQFLPQDKVKHFSALTPQQLLPQTLSTVGDGSRADVLRKLVEDQQKVVALAKEEESAAANLKTLEALQASAQNNVNLFLERKEFEKKIDFLKRQLPFARYNQIKREKEVLKGQVKEARDELRALRTA
jgi:chromosome segregation ATPase